MELTVETCLAELREMFPGKESTVEFDTNGRVLITVIDAVPFFNYHKTLVDCMNEVYQWNAQRVKAAEENTR